MQYGELRSYCGSRLVKFVLCIFIDFKDTSETRESFLIIKSSRSIECKDFSIFEMLDARIASVLNKIIQNSHFKKKCQSRGGRKPRKRIGFFVEDRSLT